jgi:hypothetical protein
MSRGSKAILCPFSLLSYEVSGAESLEGPALEVGVLTRFTSPSSLSPFDAPAPPRLRVRPDDIVISVRGGYCRVANPFE